MSRTAPHMPEQLAAAAWEVFGRRGFADATVDEIAKQAGVTKGSFYSHYRSKQEIVLAACNYYYRGYQRKVRARLASCRTPRDRLRAAVEYSVWSCVIDERTRTFTTEIFAWQLQDEAVRAGWAQFYDNVRQMYLELLAGVAHKRPAADREAAVNLMLAAIEGVKLRATFEPHIAAPGEQAAIVDGLLGILLRPANLVSVPIG